MSSGSVVVGGVARAWPVLGACWWLWCCPALCAGTPPYRPPYPPVGTPPPLPVPPTPPPTPVVVAGVGLVCVGGPVSCVGVGGVSGAEGIGG